MDKKNGISQTQLDYLRDLQRKQYRITAIQILIFAVFLLLWETSVQLGWIDGFIFSSPSRVLKTFGTMWKDRSIFRHTGITLAETLVSFVLVVAAGVGLSILLWYNTELSEILEPYLVVLNSLPKSALAPLLIVWLGANVAAGVGLSILLWYNTELSEILEPYLVVLNSLPKSALAPLLIVWLGANMKSIIVAGISVAIFGTVLNLYTGFGEMDPDKIKLIYTLRGSRRDVLYKVILPGTLPLLVSVMKVNIGLCLVGVVIGEFIGARQGLGYLIIYGSQVFKLDWVIMSIVILCVIAMLLYGALGIVERRCLKKR